MHCKNHPSYSIHPALLGQVEILNTERLKEAEAVHARLLEDIKEVNRKYLAEYEEKVKAKKASILSSGISRLGTEYFLDALFIS